MSDQSYADSGGAQIFHAGTPNANLLPVFDIGASTTGDIIATVMGGANRYTVTSVDFTISGANPAGCKVGVFVGTSTASTGNRVADIVLPDGGSNGDTFRTVLSIDLLPQECLFIRTRTPGTAGAVVVGFEGYTSRLGATEAGASIPGPSASTTTTNVPTSSIVAEAVVRSAPLIGQSE